MGFPWSKTLEHISFGMIRGMSTRRGTVEFLENILDEARDVMHEQMRSNEEKYKQVEDPEFTSDVIGISGVKVQDLSGKRCENWFSSSNVSLAVPDFFKLTSRGYNM